MLRISLHKSKGFTIVELLIVIVVIAILASISVVAYNGIQKRAKDSQRKSDVAEIIKLLSIRKVDRSTLLRSGASCNQEYDGFFTQAGISVTGSDYGAKSAATCLTEQTNTNKRFQDPSGKDSCVANNPTNCFVYMFSTCDEGAEEVLYIYAHLENETGTNTDSTCWDSFDSIFGMNYYKRFVLY